jgi:hypothetical protein
LGGWVSEAVQPCTRDFAQRLSVEAVDAFAAVEFDVDEAGVFQDA